MKNVSVNGTNYTGVSEVHLSVTGGGTANFRDVDEITTPSGSVTITENGTHDVSNYAQAVVNVASAGGDNEKNLEMITVLCEGVPTTAEDKYLTVPAGITKLRSNLFANLTNVSSTGLVYISLPDTIEEIWDKCFYYSTRAVIGTLPPNLRVIGSDFARQATSLFGDRTELEIPASVEEIKMTAFYQYNGKVTTLTFKGTPTTIANNALQNDKITTINVPWAEGVVADAPWGATKATINYNYTGA